MTTLDDALPSTDRLEAWAEAAAGAAPMPRATARVVVVVPHPDDEVLGTAGLLIDRSGVGAPTVVVAVTDGDAAYADAEGPALAACGRAEQDEALRRLGVTDGPIRLGLADGGLPALVDDVAAHLRRVLRPGDVVVAPWEHDHHSDHVACDLAARLAGTGERFGSLF